MTEHGGAGEILEVRHHHLPSRLHEGTPDLPDDIDPRTPVFLVSYAHSEGRRSAVRPKEPNQRFVDFFDDLSENVAQLIPRRPGSDPGFMDRSVAGGTRWTGELLDALGSCQVFVALLSVPYLTSTWCGMEWHAFAQRRVTRSTGNSTRHQSAIIPVIWAPLPEERIPAAVLAVQRFSPTGLPNANITAQYKANGIFGLLKQNQDDAYQAVVWSLALHIADIHYAYRVEPMKFDPADLRNLFREQYDETS